MDVSFEKKNDGKDEWLTPKFITDALGPFDLDPCSPINRPWETAKKHLTINDEGLNVNWEGRVWCNPPYGAETNKWLKKCASHKNVIALIFARTETKQFFDHVWPHAKGILFIKGRLRFYHVSGIQGGTAGSPSILVAFNEENAEILKNCSIKGHFVKNSV